MPSSCRSSRSSASTRRRSIPTAKVNVASLKKDLDYFKEVSGEVTDKAITVEQLLDMSFVEAR